MISTTLVKGLHGNFEASELLGLYSRKPSVNKSRVHGAIYSPVPGVQKSKWSIEVCFVSNGTRLHASFVRCIDCEPSQLHCTHERAQRAALASFYALDKAVVVL